MYTLFGDTPTVVGKQQRGRLDIDLLHRLECQACPLNELRNHNPHMPASGAEHPLVYVLGEGPGRQEDEEGKQFVGESGQLLRSRIPREFKGLVRFNNVVRTRPHKNETPEQRAVECCRPSIVRDIEKTRPKAIFGFGNVPLEWVMPGGTMQGITMWRGRRMPVKVGTHVCWYYPMLHPAYLLRQRGQNRDAGATAIGSEEERMYALDLKRAFAEVETLPKPTVHTPVDVWRGLNSIVEGGRAGLEAVAEALKWARGEPYLGVDYETNCLRPYAAGAKVLTAAVATGERGYAFPFEHPDALWTDAELIELADMWIDFLHTYKGVKYVHNLAFELEWTAVHFDPALIRIGKWEDTSVQASILDERKGRNKPGCFSLEFLVQQYFGFNLKKLSALDRKSLSNVPVELVLRYNAGDARYHCLLGLEQAARLKTEGLTAVHELALRRVPAVVLTQLKGVPVDQQEVKRLKKKYNARLDGLWDKVFAQPIVKEFNSIKHAEFKPLSNKDVLYVFKDMLHREECTVYDKRTRRDRYGADEDVLEQIDHPLAKLLLPYRKANKQASTYIYPLDAGFKHTTVHPDGLLHATFNTIFARTGRLSCEEPNLQNFPKRGEEAKEVRKQIKAPPGCVVVAFDYGQIEARVIAMFTHDKAFCKALWENYDVHMEWAERLARAYPARVGGKKNLTDKKIMKDFRTDIKNQWTFPLFFGATLSSAAGYLNIPEDKLAPQYREFWRIFAGVKTWQEEQLTFYRKYGYTECLTGRRRHGPISDNQLFNTPVQGTLGGDSRLATGVEGH